MKINRFSRIMMLLTALMMATTSNADCYFYIDDLQLTTDDLNTTITVPVHASFDTYVGNWDVKFIFPEGLTPVSITKGADMILPYINYRGDEHYSDGYLVIANNKDHCLSSDFCMDHLYVEEDEQYVECGTTKWEPGVYDTMLRLKFKVEDYYNGGEIEILTKATCGYDLRYNTGFVVADVVVPEDSYWPGDVNGDGLLNITDIIMVKEYIANDGVFEYDYLSFNAADVQQDGVLDIRDVEKLIDAIMWQDLWNQWYDGIYPLYEGSSTAVISMLYPQMGDINGDYQFNVTDVIYFVNLLMAGDLNYDEYYYCDVNLDGAINVSDVTVLITMLISMTE